MNIQTAKFHLICILHRESLMCREILTKEPACLFPSLWSQISVFKPSLIERWCQWEEPNRCHSSSLLSLCCLDQQGLCGQCRWASEVTGLRLYADDTFFMVLKVKPSSNRTEPDPNLMSFTKTFNYNRLMLFLFICCSWIPACLDVFSVWFWLFSDFEILI